jgi:hypothetical protein
MDAKLASASSVRSSLHGRLPRCVTVFSLLESSVAVQKMRAMSGITHVRLIPDAESGDRPAPLTNSRLLGTLLIILGAGTAAAALLGPLVTGVIEYHVSEGARDQVMGGDVAVLALVAPTSVAAGLLVMRRNRAGVALALGPSVYALYMYTQLALGNDVARYSGNSERFFPLFLALILLAGTVTVQALERLRSIDLPTLDRSISRRLGVFLLVVSLFLVFGLHVPGLSHVFTDTPPGAEYLADPVVFWTVKVMDLGFVVPFLVWTGVSLLLHRPEAKLLGYAGVGWSALLGSSIAGMAIVMQLEGDPAASTANTVVFVTFAVLAIAFAIVTYRSLLDGR